MLTLRYRLRPQDEALTLRAVARERVGMSAAQLRALGGRGLLDGCAAYLNQTGRAGALLELPLPREISRVEPVAGEVRVLWEDEALLAVFKPAGIESHPHRGGPSILNHALFYARQNEPSVCLHPAHRLDAGTEGILLLARHGCIHAMLMRAMCEGSFHKEYVGVVRGRPGMPSGTIRLPIAHDPARGPARFIDPSGQAAWTDYETLCAGEKASTLRFVLRTGRTHQIRVHAAAMGHPLLGDALYGGGAGGYRLCASRLTFPHPLTGETVELRVRPSWTPSEV